MSQARHRTASSTSSPATATSVVASTPLEADSDAPTSSFASAVQAQSSHQRTSSVTTGLSTRLQSVQPFTFPSTTSGTAGDATPPKRMNDSIATGSPSQMGSPRLVSTPPNPLQQRRTLTAATPAGLVTPVFLINRDGDVVDHISPNPGPSSAAAANTLRATSSPHASPRPGRRPNGNAVSSFRDDSSDALPISIGGAGTKTEPGFFAPSSAFGTDEKYPPSMSGLQIGRADSVDAGRNGGGSLRIPLLSDADGYASNGFGASGASNIATSRLGVNSTKLAQWKTKISPLMLLPAFMLGIFLAMTGTFGPNLASSGFDKTVRKPYELHKSGHLFLHPSSLDPSSVGSNLLPDQVPKRRRGVRHPIHDLVKNATIEWEEKLARQSTNLVDAVKEYKRRYGRRPPKGFDKWYQFARENKVVLIDEFDQVFNDILPFYALPPHVLHNRSMYLQQEESTFTMRIRKGAVEIIGAHAKDGRAKDQAALMKRWSRHINEVNITMSAHDGPSLMLDHNTKQKHIDAARAGVHLSEEELEIVDEDPAWWGFPLACSNHSRLRRAYEGLEIATLPPGPSYIANHLMTMNMCDNPEWQYLHGFTAWPGSRPQPLKPLFSFAKTTMHADILLTPLEQYWDHEVWDPVWEKKPYNKAVWRGTTTGVWFDRGTWWRNSQRVRLWFKSKDETGSQRVRFDGQGTITPRGVPSIVEKNVPTRALVDRYLDFAFTGKAGQCDVEDGSCDAVRNLFDFQRPFGWNEANEYKYQLDLDGNAWSGRFHRLLSGNQAVLKSTIFPEWYSTWIQPWVHYIPIKVDYTDLFDVMAFFSGDLDDENAHEDMAKVIAREGKEFAETYWRYADMETYLFRLALEWARCSAPDRSKMDYTGPGA